MEKGDLEDIRYIMQAVEIAEGRRNYRMALTGNECAYKEMYKLWENELKGERRDELNEMLEILVNHGQELAGLLDQSLIE